MIAKLNPQNGCERGNRFASAFDQSTQTQTTLFRSLYLQNGGRPTGHKHVATFYVFYEFCALYALYLWRGYFVG